MIRTPRYVVPRRNLALVQHVDGFGTPSQKLATYKAVARPSQFVMGFKLFYDEDTPMMRPASVLRIRPQVRFAHLMRPESSGIVAQIQRQVEQEWHALRERCERDSCPQEGGR